MKQLWKISLCCLLIVALAGCASKETVTNKESQTTEEKANKVTGRDISDIDGPALKDLYADYFMMGAAINGSEKETAAIHHDGMSAVLKKHYNSTTLSNLMKPCYLLDEKACAKAGKKNANLTDVSFNFESCE